MKEVSAPGTGDPGYLAHLLTLPKAVQFYFNKNNFKKERKHKTDGILFINIFMALEKTDTLLSDGWIIA